MLHIPKNAQNQIQCLSRHPFEKKPWVFSEVSLRAELLDVPRPSTIRFGQVILSAGALLSPQLLMLSGIGDAKHLKEHGIPCVLDLPALGRTTCRRCWLRVGSVGGSLRLLVNIYYKLKKHFFITEYLTWDGGIFYGSIDLECFFF